MTRLRIGFLLPRYPTQESKSQMPVAMRLLADAGVEVEVVCPSPRIFELGRLEVRCDLYVLKWISGLALSVAGELHARGAAIVNPYPATVALVDRIIVHRILQAAGVPTPASYVTSRAGQLAPLLDAGPLVVKPYRGSCGANLPIIRSAADLEHVQCEKWDPVFAQRYHKPDGRDRKLYCIGDTVYGVKKVFPRQSDVDKYGEPFTPSPDLRDIALSCGRAFGIDLYGVDIVESEGQPYVVDMSSIPGFKGVPDAPSHLAKYFYEAALRAARGRPPRETAVPLVAPGPGGVV